MRWTYPLPHAIKRLPRPGEPGCFGAVRKHDVHTGVDLYCADAEFVQAVEHGKIVSIEQFTGAQVGSPWWNDTWAVLVKGHSGIVCYGELSMPIPHKVGDSIGVCGLIGMVATVLKKDKGLPMSMLHLELYDSGSECPVWWHHGQPRPKGLRDPTALLKNAIVFTEPLPDPRRSK